MLLTPQMVQHLATGVKADLGSDALNMEVAIEFVVRELLGACKCGVHPCKHQRAASTLRKEVRQAAVIGVRTLVGTILPDPSHGVTKEQDGDEAR